MATNSQDTSPSDPPLWAPRHWPSWLNVGVFWSASKLPYPLMLKAGRLIGLVLVFIGKRKRRRHIAEVNLRLCFPQLDDAAIEELLRRHIINLALSLLEMNMAWWASERRLKKLIDIEGLEHLEAALAKGRGAILLSGHLTTFEIGNRLLSIARGAKHNALYRTNKNPVLEWVQRTGRQRSIAKPIPHDDMRQMIKRLKNNEIIWYAPDQNFGHKHSIFAPFFGTPAASNTTTSRLSRISGAAVLPFFQHRKQDGSGYKVVIQAPLENFPSENLLADTTRVNMILEEQIRLSPEQYLWVHRRFKDRPDGGRDIYHTPQPQT